MVREVLQTHMPDERSDLSAARVRWEASAMSTNRIRRRLEALEERPTALQPSGSSPARERMREHLDRLAAHRRGDMLEEERPAFEEAHAEVTQRLAEIRREGRYP